MSSAPEEIGQTVRLALQLALPSWGATARLILIAVAVVFCLAVLGRYMPLTSWESENTVHSHPTVVTVLELGRHSNHGLSV